MALSFPAGLPDNTYSLRVYETNVATANFADHQIIFAHPADANKQAWSHCIRISAVGGDIEFSFDGATVHGKVLAGTTADYFQRYEGGVAVRGDGNTYIVEAW